MRKTVFFLNSLLVLLIWVAFLSNPGLAFAADRPKDGSCVPGDYCCGNDGDPIDPTFVCVRDNSQSCQPHLVNGAPTKDALGRTNYLCQPSTVGTTFGKIQAPGPLAGLLKNDPTGAGAISTFLSNFVILIFSLAGVVLIFMILWGAFDWLISEGDKEKVAAARSKILNALIGITLFAIAFAIIRMFGVFTGFTFFKNQNIRIERGAPGTSIIITCPDGVQFFVPYSSNPDTSVCQGHGN